MIGQSPIMGKRPSCCRSRPIDPSSHVGWIAMILCSAVIVAVQPLFLNVSSFAFQTVPKRRVSQGYSIYRPHTSTTTSRNIEICRYSHSPLDGPESAQPLPLSKADLARIDDMKTRGKVIPVVLMDAMLPGQRIYFSR
jgi:hypothetical protein